MRRDKKIFFSFLAISLIPVIAVSGLFIIYFGFHLNLSLSEAPNDWSTFANYFSGTLNPVYAYLAFLGVVYTVFLQQKQLTIAKKQVEIQELQKLVGDLSESVETILNKRLPSKYEIDTVREAIPIIGGEILNKESIYETQNLNDEIRIDLTLLLIELKQFPAVLDEYKKVGGTQFLDDYYSTRYGFYVMYICKIKETDFTLGETERMRKTFKTDEWLKKVNNFNSKS